MNLSYMKYTYDASSHVVAARLLMPSALITHLSGPVLAPLLSPGFTHTILPITHAMAVDSGYTSQRYRYPSTTY